MLSDRGKPSKAESFGWRVKERLQDGGHRARKNIALYTGILTDEADSIGGEGTSLPAQAQLTQTDAESGSG